MKKNVLALSIATMVGGLGLSGAAMAAPAAFAVNESGTGTVQIVPYFTAQDGNATVLHVVNTDTTHAKAVKVRFRGASNSDDLLDFQVFLSPGDVWTGMASADAEGRLQLVTNDNSCTLPESVRKDGVTKAPVDRLTNKLWDTDAKKFAQTREGYIEILEMATIPTTTKPATDSTLTPVEKLFHAVKHVKTDSKMVAPCTLTALKALDAVTDGATITAGSSLTPPTNSLAASWYIINVAKSTTFSGSATALNATAATLRPVYATQKAGLTTTLGSADPLFAAGKLDAQDFDFPDLSTSLTAPVSTAVGALTVASTVTNAIAALLADTGLTYTLADVQSIIKKPAAVAGDTLAAGDRTLLLAEIEPGAAKAQAAALSNALSRAQVFNQFYHDAVLNAATDWVFSMPTRRYLVAADYAATNYTKAGGYVVKNSVALGGSNTKFATDANIDVNSQGQICVTANGQFFYDREEDSITDGHVVSPGVAKKLQLCGEVSVATFGAKSPLGAAIAASNIDNGFDAGWGYVNFASDAQLAAIKAGPAEKTAGVPALGAAFTAASNPNAAAGMVGNYGITWPHFYTDNK